MFLRKFFSKNLWASSLILGTPTNIVFMNLSFEQLSQINLNEATKTLGKIFPDNAEIAGGHYKESLDQNNPRWKTHRFWKYYVVLDVDTGKILAITGFYNLTIHSKDEVWLGWYGVSPEFRGRGVGRKVLEWTLKTAKEIGYKKFRLWTTTSPEEVLAQKLYDNMGIKIYDQKDDKEKKYTILYREKILT